MHGVAPFTGHGSTCETGPIERRYTAAVCRAMWEAARFNAMHQGCPIGHDSAHSRSPTARCRWRSASRKAARAPMIRGRRHQRRMGARVRDVRNWDVKSQRYPCSRQGIGIEGSRPRCRHHRGQRARGGDRRNDRDRGNLSPPFSTVQLPGSQLSPYLGKCTVETFDGLKRAVLAHHQGPIPGRPRKSAGGPGASSSGLRRRAKTAAYMNRRHVRRHNSSRRVSYALAACRGRHADTAPAAPKPGCLGTTEHPN